MALWNIIVKYVSLGVLTLLACHARDYTYENKKCNFASDSLWQSCDPDKDLSQEECKSLGCCYAPPWFLQLHKIDKRCLKPLLKDGINNGTCVIYDGPNCSPFLNDNSSNNTLRYVDNTYGVKKTDEVFEMFFDAIRRNGIKTVKCLELLTTSLCKYGVPKCRVDNSSEAICREDCEYIFDVCGADLKKLVSVIQSMAVKDNIDFSHLILPDCNLLSYSYDVHAGTNNSCGYLVDGIDRTPKEPETTEDDKKKFIYIGIGASTFLIIVIIAIICFDRYKTKKKRKAETDLEFIASMTSIRDRLRQDSTSQNPLLELLASSKPGDLVQYPLDCVEYIQDLGEGQFGKVFQGRVHGVVKGEESTDVAVKCLKEGSTGQALESFNQEVALMSVLRHANVLQLLAVSTEEEPYCMIFEFMENGDLNEYLRKWKGKERLSETDQLTICWHIASGMEYLASKKFLHRDLATRNCLVGKDLLVKIADFGMSRNVYHSDYYRVGGEAMLPIRWMPPEAILYGKFTVSADVYSYGVVMWEVFSFALQPFYGYSNEEVVEFIKKGVLLPMPEICPEWVYDTMLLCWKRDTEDRITFTEIIKIFKEKSTPPVYHKPRQHASPNSTYSLLGEDEGNSTPYDQPKRNSRDSTLSAVKLGNDQPRYQNVRRDIDGEELTKKNASPPPPSLPLKSKSNSNYQNISPSTSGEINPSFNDDDEKLIKPRKSLSVDATKRKDSATPSGKSPRSQKSLKIRAAIDAKTSRRASSIDKGIKAASLGGGRSIKDVLKNDVRYVSSDNLRRNSSMKKNDDERPSSSFESSFRPTSEFLEFHGYGKDIQSENNEEKMNIKKIIDQTLTTEF